MPKTRKIEIRGLIIHVEATPIKHTFLNTTATIGNVEKVAARDVLRLEFSASGTKGLKKLIKILENIKIPNKAL